MAGRLFSIEEGRWDGRIVSNSRCSPFVGSTVRGKEKLRNDGGGGEEEKEEEEMEKELKEGR